MEEEAKDIVLLLCWWCPSFNRK